MKYKYQGKTYSTLAACYEDNKHLITVGITTVRKRLKEKWELDKALLTPKKTGLDTRLGTHIVEGVEYPSLPSVSEEYGINLNTINKRYSSGKRGDELIPEKKRKGYVAPAEKEPAYKFFAAGKGYKSKADACRQLSVKYVTFRSRKYKGATNEQALGLEPLNDLRGRGGGGHMKLMGEAIL